MCVCVCVCISPVSFLFFWIFLLSSFFFGTKKNPSTVLWKSQTITAIQECADWVGVKWQGMCWGGDEWRFFFYFVIFFNSTVAAIEWNWFCFVFFLRFLLFILLVTESDQYHYLNDINTVKITDYSFSRDVQFVVGSTLTFNMFWNWQNKCVQLRGPLVTKIRRHGFTHWYSGGRLLMIHLWLRANVWNWKLISLFSKSVSMWVYVK